jgi:hypothetical protein
MKKRSLRWKILVKNINDKVSLKSRNDRKKTEKSSKSRRGGSFGLGTRIDFKNSTNS